MGNYIHSFLGLPVHIELVGPTIPLHRDGERINLFGYTHEFETGCSCKSENKNTRWIPSLVSLYAGIAAYSSWIQTIFIEEINISAIFSDYCKEAAHLAASSKSTVIKRSVNVLVNAIEPNQTTISRGR
ncbi:hypothetical protein GIB67_037317 [Kingdonia uniflora]|uniref:Uncharacterized protein n=1 Tax=Kingdonia uniflora TaxID=39325 RepID=A0A7J7MSB6_9MAGN|nr:hypothetical protein GIB67_037317 [Kingdonia uniflora]